MTTTVLPPAPQTTPAPVGDRLGGAKRARALLAGGAMLVLIMVVFLATLTFGSVFVPVRDVLAVLLGQDGVARTASRIVVELRLPRAVAALAVGAALGAAGLQMQTLFRNPLASPSTLGINSGASLGVALVVLPGGLASAG
ncbi:MAG: iron chelate uptake ABC transporter family permease subunit, partial [Acidimicrobiales bacterium]